MRSLLSHSTGIVPSRASSDGIPIDAALAGEVAKHFEKKRNAVFRYRR